MTTLTRRPYMKGTDRRALVVAECGESVAMLFAEITDLVKLNNPTGQLDEDTLVDDLQRFFEAPDFDRRRDLRLWKDSNGRVIGFGQLLMSKQNDEIEGNLYFDVHPSRYTETLETEILQWSEKRLCEVRKERAVRVKLCIRTQDTEITRQMLLERQGFTIDRSFLTMACSLDQLFCPSSLPKGFTLQRLSRESIHYSRLSALERMRQMKKIGERREITSVSSLPSLPSPTSLSPSCGLVNRCSKDERYCISLCDLNDWVDLFNESFIDHWDHHDLTVEAAGHWLMNPHYKPALNLMAVASDGTFAAFCVGYINREENTRSGRKEGWIKLLGTRRGFRKLGLGRSLLLAQMRQLKAAGVEQVKLGVDAQSLTSATRLYESVGFQPINTWLSYVKEIR